jgi:RNA polymerase sigma-70 factor (ECF subfamily)
MEKNRFSHTNCLSHVSSETLEETYKRLNTYCRKFVGREDAQDIAMMAFIKVWEKDRKLSDPRNLGSYLRKIALNTIHDLKRQQRKASILDANTIDLPEQVNNRIQDAEKQIQIEIVTKEIKIEIENLPEQCRLVFKLHLQRKTTKEISNALAIDIKTVYAHCANARDKIRASLKKKGMMEMYID